MKIKKSRSPVKRRMPVWGWIILIVGFLAIASFIILQLSKPVVVPLPAEITVAQAAQKRDQGAFILDVREPSEWVQFHLTGATLIPLGDLPNRLGEIPRDRDVIVVCRTGHRSAQGRDILLKAGFTRVTSMAGGITQWQTQGLPLATGQ